MRTSQLTITQVPGEGLGWDKPAEDYTGTGEGDGLGSRAPELCSAEARGDHREEENPEQGGYVR